MKKIIFILLLFVLFTNTSTHATLLTDVDNIYVIGRFFVIQNDNGYKATTGHLYSSYRNTMSRAINEIKI